MPRADATPTHCPTCENRGWVLLSSLEPDHMARVDFQQGLCPERCAYSALVKSGREALGNPPLPCAERVASAQRRAA